MLEGISEDGNREHGKRVSEMSKMMVKHNYSIGIKEWERPLGSVYKYEYIDRIPQPHNFKPPHPSSSEVVIPHEHGVNMERTKNHYRSETNKSYVNFVNAERRKPLLAMEDLTSSKLVEASLKEGFGYGKNTKTASEDSLCVRNSQVTPQLNWKPQRERFNPITNEVYGKTDLLKASQFDFYNDLKSKNRETHNHSHIPLQKERINVITGEKLPIY